jgi:hypothetical protein
MAHEFDVWDVEGYTSVVYIGLIIENKMFFFCIKKKINFSNVIHACYLIM